MTIEEAKANIGKEVVYIPFEDCAEKDLEPGIIIGVKFPYVYVQYENESISRGTRPRDLKLKEETKNDTKRSE